MFTGIVEETGAVVDVHRRADVLSVEIGAGKIVHGLPEGGSIAVNGCCLTAVQVANGRFVCDLTAETLARTGFDARLVPGAKVNLERPMKADGRFDGHIVQGHVDGVGRITRFERLQESAEIWIEVPADFERYLVLKGSVAVDGVSLTVASLVGRVFSVALIPYTLEATNLGGARPGGLVCLEADVIAKYVERLLAARG